jgi:hypothetical protein
VAPLRDAVGLVDDEQRDLDVDEALAEARIRQPLGRDVGDARALVGEPGQRGGLVARRHRRVEPHDVDAQLDQLVVLILHQRDQRRHHQRDAGQLERRQLVAQRLARAGRHDRQRVDAGHDVADRQRLAGAERGDAEAPRADLEQVRLERRAVVAREHRIGDLGELVRVVVDHRRRGHQRRRQRPRRHPHAAPAYVDVRPSHIAQVRAGLDDAQGGKSANLSTTLLKFDHRAAMLVIARTQNAAL